MSENVLNLDEAAQFLQVTGDTVETLLESGQVAGRRIEGEWRTTIRALLFYVDGGVGSSTGCVCPPGCVPGEGAQAAGCCSGLPGCC